MGLFDKKTEKAVEEAVVEETKTKKAKKAEPVDAEQPDPNRNMSWFKGK